MNLHEAVSKHLQPHAFRIVRGGVEVTNQDNLQYLKNKLKQEGLNGVPVTYFDGKRTFTADELKSVMVIGEGSDRATVFKVLDNLHAQHTFTKLIFIDTYPSRSRASDEWVREWATERRVAIKRVDVHWKFGPNAPVIRYTKLLGKRSRTKPNIVVAFTNKETTKQVTQAQNAGVEVIFA